MRYRCLSSPPHTLCHADGGGATLGGIGGSLRSRGERGRTKSVPVVLLSPLLPLRPRAAVPLSAAPPPFYPAWRKPAARISSGGASEKERASTTSAMKTTESPAGTS
jgi:hypothetical protein